MASQGEQHQSTLYSERNIEAVLRGDTAAYAEMEREWNRSGRLDLLEEVRQKIAQQAVQAFPGEDDKQAFITLCDASEDGPKVGLCIGFVGYLSGLGLVMEARMYTGTSDRDELPYLICEPHELVNWRTYLARLENRIQAFQRHPELAREALKARHFEPRQILGFDIWDVELQPELPPEHPRDAARRTRALETMMGRYPAVAQYVLDEWGLRLPRSLAVFAAFLESLSPFERYAWDKHDIDASGLLELFQDGALAREILPGLDARLECRYRRDPPEFVTVLLGGADGLHYGLWYDDPAELPSGVAANYARDDAVTYWSSETLCDLVREMASEPFEYAEALRDAFLLRALDAFQDALTTAREADGDVRWAQAPREATWLCGLNSAFDGEVPQGHTLNLFHDPEWVQKAIREAFSDLERGRPETALCLGRELHWWDEDETSDAACILMISAYERLGRHALAEIVRVHYKHRERRHVGAFMGF